MTERDDRGVDDAPGGRAPNGASGDASGADDRARASATGRPSGPRRLRALAGAAGLVGVVALVALLLVQGPGGDDDEPSGAATTPAATTTGPAGPAPGDGVVVQVFVADGATPAQVERLRTRLAGLSDEGAITGFAYVSKEEALAGLRERLEDPSILDELPANPLPASFEISPRSQADADAVAAAIGDDPAIDPELGVFVGRRDAPVTGNFGEEITPPPAP